MHFFVPKMRVFIPILVIKFFIKKSLQKNKYGVNIGVDIGA
jgi:hypothetical protein